jgi:hypothetical protein
MSFKKEGVRPVTSFNVRTNEADKLILSINKPFGKNKKGQFCEKTKLSCMVAPTGIEPVFKV